MKWKADRKIGCDNSDGLQRPSALSSSNKAMSSRYPETEATAVDDMKALPKNMALMSNSFRGSLLGPDRTNQERKTEEHDRADSVSRGEVEKGL